MLAVRWQACAAICQLGLLVAAAYCSCQVVAVQTCQLGWPLVGQVWALSYTCSCHSRPVLAPATSQAQSGQLPSNTRPGCAHAEARSLLLFPPSPCGFSSSEYHSLTFITVSSLYISVQHFSLSAANCLVFGYRFLWLPLLSRWSCCAWCRSSAGWKPLPLLANGSSPFCYRLCKSCRVLCSAGLGL